MKQRMKRSTASLALLAGLVGSAGFSTSSQACPVEPYIGSVCVMAWPKINAFGHGTFFIAAGGGLAISQYSPLFAVIGITYGGNGTTNFMLPDLRGKTIVGVGTNPDNGMSYSFGQKGGAAFTTLTTAQMPAHNHTLTSGTGGVTATATIGNLAATTSLSGVTATVSGSGLTLNGSTGGTLSNNPSNASLATLGQTSKFYSDATPTVAMKAGAISGTAQVAWSGNPSTALTGAPTVTVSGVTNVNGSGQPGPVPTMSPFLAMPYYIAVSGVFPTPD